MAQSTSFEGDGRETIGRPMMARPICVTVEDEREFQLAMEEYKRRSGRLFPTWSEILEVLRALGYAKRIWRPVDFWAPLVTQSAGKTPDGDESVGAIGWCSRVETPAGT
jgi:hypothetical protein